jgi:anti-sigma regulatory factor (Ser/Thr protein kinase)
MPTELSVEIPRTATAPFLARRALADLESRIDPEVLPDVRLLISELITNSVKYGGEGPIRLVITANEGCIRAEIIDHGAGFTPTRRGGDLEKVGGWGLHLVEKLTTDWGIYDGSTHVWFEIDRR